MPAYVYARWHEIGNSERLTLATIMLILASVFLVAGKYFIPAEDAVILYEYAKNLATDGIVTYGHAGKPIEGATDFLWMILIAGGRFLGIQEYVTALFLNFTAICLFLPLLPNVWKKVVFVIALLATPYFYSALSGFSTIFFSISFVLALHFTLKNSKWAPLSILVMCLIRPDGVAWGAGLVVYRLLAHHDRDAIKEQCRQTAIWLVLPGLAYFAWRCWYFGELLPLPFLVKSNGMRDTFGLLYWTSIASFFFAWGPLFAVTMLFKGWKYTLRIASIFAIAILFYAAMRLEQNIGNRFAAPLFFGGGYLLARHAHLAALLLFSLASSWLLWPNTVDTIGYLVNSRAENVHELSRDLDTLQGSMLTTEAGRLAYYSGWSVEDSWGLNTPRFAKRLITAEDLRQGSYDLIVAHCGLRLLNRDTKISSSHERSWNNQCAAIVDYIRNADYTVYLVPFIAENTKHIWMHTAALAKCRRHDIYAIRNDYRNFAALRAIILKHDAIPYKSGHTQIRNDKVCR